jgi:hypothetical protein
VPYSYSNVFIALLEFLLFTLYHDPPLETCILFHFHIAEVAANLMLFLLPQFQVNSAAIILVIFIGLLKGSIIVDFTG